MALSSMTGFARSHGASGPYTFEWELKSVNAKGFDLRLRLPPGFEALETPVRLRVREQNDRGSAPRFKPGDSTGVTLAREAVRALVE